MGFRIVEISRPGELHVQKGQLQIEQEEGQCSIPVEDIMCLLFTGTNIRISTMALTILAEAGVQVILCNTNNMPSAILTPAEGNYQQSLVMYKQIEMDLEMKNAMWTKIVRRKIENQAEALKILGNDVGSQTVLKYLDNLSSGDMQNCEGSAAKAYFQYYWPGLVRKEESPINSALNYGYAIIRTYISKRLYCVGLLAALGVHHANQFNAFNLADDLIEPFRPMVDLLALEIGNKGIRLSKEERHKLIEILHYKCMFNGNSYSIDLTVDKVINSLKTAILENDINALVLPSVIPLEKTSSVRE